MMQTVPLGEVAHIIMGSAPPGESYNSEGVGLPMIAGAGDYGVEHPEPKKWTSAPTQVSNRGDLIVCIRATIGDLNWSDREYCLGRGVAGVRPRDSRLDLRYLAHYLDSRKEALLKLGTGSTFLAIRRADLEEFPIPLPPLPEQKRIAAILDKADAIRKKRKKATELTEVFFRAAFTELTRRYHAASFSIGDLIENGAITLHKDGNHGSQYPRAEEFGEVGVPFLSAKCIRDGEIDDTEAQHLKESKAATLRIGWIEGGDVLLAHNATVGPVALYDGFLGRAIIGTSLTAFRVNPAKMLPEFLCCALLSDFFQNQLQKNMGQTTRNQVPITAQRELLIQVPSYDDQRRFAGLLNTRKKRVAKLRSTETMAKLLLNSLVRSAFRGEL